MTNFFTKRKEAKSFILFMMNETHRISSLCGNCYKIFVLKTLLGDAVLETANQPLMFQVWYLLPDLQIFEYILFRKL